MAKVCFWFFGVHQPPVPVLKSRRAWYGLKVLLFPERTVILLFCIRPDDIPSGWKPAKKMNVHEYTILKRCTIEGRTFGTSIIFTCTPLLVV